MHKLHDYMPVLFKYLQKVYFNVSWFFLLLDLDFHIFTFISEDIKAQLCGTAVFLINKF